MHEVISVPTADLRSPTGELLTQLRRAERVRILARQGNRLHVEALDQPQFTDNWHGYRGWIDAASVRPWRATVVDAARECLGWKYLWGGLGDGEIDCSGLVHLAYRQAGIQLPRDACDQARHCHRTETPQPGDLLFMAKKENSQKVVHVMLLADDGCYIEATSFSGTVRRVDLDTRLRQPVPVKWTYFHASVREN